MGVEQSLLV